MLPLALLAPLLPMVMAAPGAAGQGLDLEPPPELPAIEPEASAAAALAATLEEEAARLVERGGGDAGWRAAVNLRVLAADLLAAGARVGPEASPAVLAGLTLARARESIDASLARLERPAGEAIDPQAQRVQAALERFNQATLGPELRVTPAAHLDADLARILAPLLDALSEAGGPGTAWPTRAQVERQAAPAPVPAVVELRRRGSDAPLSEATRGELMRILGYLERGERFEELRPQVLDCRGVVAGALEAAAALGEATWMSGSARAEGQQQFHAGLVRFADPVTRAQGRERLRHLDQAGRLVRRITAMTAAGVTNLEALQAALLSAISADDTGPAASRLRLLRGVIDDMERFRELSASEPPRGEFTQQQRELERLYRQAERALLDHLATVVDDPAPLADPALSSLVTEHHQYREDVERVARMSEWMATIGLIDARAGPGITAQARRLARWLVDPSRRPDAVRLLDELQRQLAMFYPLPFEREIGGAEEAAIAFTGGRHLEYIAVIHQRRALWARAWAEGQASGPAADAMLLLWRLNRTMQDAAAAPGAMAEGALLNRWGAWEMDGPLLARLLEALPNRLKVAAASAIDGDEVGLRRQVERIEQDAPLARLTGRLVEALGPALRDGQVASGLAQVAGGPGEEAWSGERRIELASVCRYAWEESQARSKGDQALAEALSRWINALARALLADLGDGPVAIPTLPALGQP
jgi:hypothetical protein